MINQLCTLKVKWYGNMFMKTLYEYTVALLLWGAIFIFGVFNLSSISKPIAIFLGPDLSMKSISLYLIVINLIFIILFCCQRSLLFNSEFESYLKTLPISNKTHRLSSLLVLFISNHFLWVIFLIGAYISFSSQPILMVVMEIIYLTFSLLIMQLCLYEKHINKFILICVSNLIFIFAKSTFSIALFNLTMSLLILLNLRIGLAEIQKNSINSRGWVLKRLLNGPTLSMQLAMLRPYQNQLLLKIVFSLAIQLLTAMMVTHRENPNLVYVILLFNYLTISLMSSYSRLLAQETEKMAGYFLCLPLKKEYWFKKHQVFNFIITMLVLLPCTTFAWSSKVFNVSMIFYQWLSILVINAIVYYIHLKNYRNTTLLLSLVISLLYAIQLLMS